MCMLMRFIMSNCRHVGRKPTNRLCRIMLRRWRNGKWRVMPMTRTWRPLVRLVVVHSSYLQSSRVCPLSRVTYKLTCRRCGRLCAMVLNCPSMSLLRRNHGCQLCRRGPNSLHTLLRGLRLVLHQTTKLLVTVYLYTSLFTLATFCSNM